MELALITVIILHGFFHALGFLKSYQLAHFSHLTQAISHFQGIIWLLSGILFLCAAILFAFQQTFWWLFLGIAIIASQSLIVSDWQDAKFGTVANAWILVATIIGLNG